MQLKQFDMSKIRKSFHKMISLWLLKLRRNIVSRKYIELVNIKHDFEDVQIHIDAAKDNLLTAIRILDVQIREASNQ